MKQHPTSYNIGCRSIWPRRLETDGIQTYVDMDLQNLRGTKTKVKILLSTPELAKSECEIFPFIAFGDADGVRDLTM